MRDMVNNPHVMSLTIAGYLVKEKIYESRRSLVYRAWRKNGDQPVVLKVLKQTHPSPRKIAAFKREFEITRSLQGSGVIRVHELASDQHRPVIVMEDSGGEALTQLLRRTSFPLDLLLPIMIRIAEALEQVHRQQVIHKDINPSNILLDLETGTVKIIDFGIATRLSRENPILQHLDSMEGTLAYMSPEQTGRTNRALDYRTDFYSLGITYYELLSGRLPFSTSDPFELVYAHIAQCPPAPHEIVSTIPPVLSALVLKLMAKNAEDRYQSVNGLKSDLGECLRQWQATGQIESFPLGRHDAADRLSLSQKLYGREQDMARFLAAVARVEQGACELLLVAGQAGIGKTALIQECCKSLLYQQGYFVAGKFDQLQRNVPYAALTQAFRLLIRQILTESEERVAAWRSALQSTLGPNLQVVRDVIPEIELIVGVLPALSLRPSLETQNRFNRAVQNFLRVFTGPGRPLVIFLDDLQWADAASLSLLRHLMTTPENRHLLVIGAYRDNEVSRAHPLHLLLDEFSSQGASLSRIVLSPLDCSAVQAFIADTLSCPLERVKSLAELVLSKTGGNPFFIGEFLKSLYTARLLTFESQSRAWLWNVSQIRERHITDNVVDLLIGKLQKLAGETLEVLKLAACLGNSFDLRTLSMVCEKSPMETASQLWLAIAEGFLLPLNDAYKLAEIGVEGSIDEARVEYKFAHDRIQQSAYSLISEADRPAIHWRVGQLLLRETPPNLREQKIFDVVDHLNLGRTALQPSISWEQFASLNLQAGRRAKAAAAYAPACQYLQIGIAILPEQAWKRRYELTLALHLEAAEAASLSGDFKLMEHLTTIIFRQATNLLDEVKAYEIVLHAYSARGMLREGVNTGLHILTLLGEDLPAVPSQADVAHALRGTQGIMTNECIARLAHLPTMTDPHVIAKMRILSSMLNLAYTAVPLLFPLIVFRMVNLSVTHGNISYSAQAYATYGIILCNAGDIEAGYQCGLLALNLVERLNARELQASVIYMVETFVRHWKEHLRETLRPLREGCQAGLENGDLIYGAFNAQGYGFQSYWLGAELSGLEQDMAAYSDTMRQLKQAQALNLNEIYRQMVLNLLGRADDPCRLIGECYNEDAVLCTDQQAPAANITCFLYSSKLVLCCLFQRYPEALAYAAIAEKQLDSLVGTAAIPGFHFYDSLSRLAVFSSTEEPERAELLARVDANQEKMQLWAQSAPMNFLHKFYLVEAERARVLGKDRDAREYYDQAIDLAHEHAFVNEEALANELAARFYLAKGQARLAQHYLQDAHYAYRRWGAEAKVKDLETRYSQFLTSPGPSFSSSQGATFTASTGQHLSSAFDFTSVLNASQSISKEIRLDQLLTRLMQLVLENAGAQRGLLLLEKDGQLVVEAEHLAARAGLIERWSVSLEAYPELPLSVIHYVARTNEPLTLHDAAQEDPFAKDPYIVRKHSKSMLCAPILSQGQSLGLIYLENDVAVGAFTLERLEIVKLLSSQAAISLKNADLYQSVEVAKEQLENVNKTLELKVEERTQELQRRNQELEIANEQVREAARRKSQFLAGMSHELRTPMNAILGFTRLVLRRVGDLVPERQRDNLLKVIESANQLLGLINQLLDLSRLEAGRMEVHPSFFNARQCLLDCYEMVSVSPLVKPAVQVCCEIAEHVSNVQTDEEGLRHIVLNLLSNAVKFTDRGEVRVSATVEDQPGGEPALVIIIADTGVGIPTEALGSIFEEFQQVEGGVRKREGTGLGLPIARRWVERLGGVISVESEIGKGSTFTVVIPTVYQAENQLAVGGAL